MVPSYASKPSRPFFGLLFEKYNRYQKKNSIVWLEYYLVVELWLLFFTFFSRSQNNFFLSKLWIYYMHINMLCYTTLPQQQNCFVNFESLTTPLRTFVNENMFTEAHPHMQNSWVVFLVNNVTNTRYKVKIDESTTTSKFYNLFQYNFCKKNLWVGAGEKNCTTVEKRLIGSTAAAR